MLVVYLSLNLFIFVHVCLFTLVIPGKSTKVKGRTEGEKIFNTIGSEEMPVKKKKKKETNISHKHRHKQYQIK
jgi:hypothetical protein